MAEATKAARLQAKANNFKAAVEVGKVRLEREHSCRLQRYKCFDEHVANTSTEARDAADDASRARALQRFADRERRGVLAKCKMWTTDDFESVRVLGEGAFGVVHLVKHKGTEDYYALKQMLKMPQNRKNLRRGAFAERDLLAEARSRWFVELYATFQDANNVYMVMEFLQGGDLIGHLMKRRRFSKLETRFYMAELLEGLDTVHKSGFVHRDVKPDNMVLTAAGHLKLLDFGLCAHDPSAVDSAGAGGEFSVEAEAIATDPNRGVHGTRAPSAGTPSRRGHLKSVVGTPQYMAPEVYRGASGIEADIWALGIITFECLVGYVPFHSGEKTGIEAHRMVRDKVLKHSEHFPRLLNRSAEKGYIRPVSYDFLSKVVCERHERLTAEDCRRDPFFFGIDFARLHLATPPIVPDVRGPADASQFDDDFDAAPWPPPASSAMKDASLEWAHYEFDRNAYDLQRPNIDAGELDELCGSLNGGKQCS